MPTGAYAQSCECSVAFRGCRFLRAVRLWLHVGAFGLNASGHPSHAGFSEPRRSPRELRCMPIPTAFRACCGPALSAPQPLLDGGALSFPGTTPTTSSVSARRGFTLIQISILLMVAALVMLPRSEERRVG